MPGHLTGRSFFATKQNKLPPVLASETLEGAPVGPALGAQAWIFLFVLSDDILIHLCSMRISKDPLNPVKFNHFSDYKAEKAATKKFLT